MSFVKDCDELCRKGIPNANNYQEIRRHIFVQIELGMILDTMEHQTGFPSTELQEEFKELKVRR